jgi:hypothetical protein
MPRKYRIEASFSLTTTIEPEGIDFDRSNADYEDFEDNSHFSSQEVEADNGSLAFTVEAEDEDDARRLGEEVVYDGMEVEDSYSVTWLVDSLNMEIERIEEEMTLERAREVLTAVAESADDEEVGEAVGFVFSYIGDITTNVERLEGLVRDLSARLQAVEERTAPPSPFDAPGA